MNPNYLLPIAQSADLSAPVQPVDVSVNVQPSDATTVTTTVQPADAAAQAEQPQQSPMSGLMSMLPIILIFVVIMVFMSRSQKKQAARREEALSKIMKGDRVVTNAGIFGTVAEVKADTFIVEIAPNVKVEITKQGVASAVAPDDAAAGRDGK